MRLFKRGIVLSLVFLLTFQGIPITHASEVDFVDVSDENYERAEQFVLLESYLQEIGLSIEDIMNTNIDLTEIDPDDFNDAYSNPHTNALSSGNETNMFLQSKQFATNLYGANATNEEVIKTYLLYYVDVHDGDRNAGKVWDNLPAHYYPTYMTNEDDRVYNLVIDNLSNGRLVDMFKDAAQAANSIPNAISLSDLKNKMQNMEVGLEVIKNTVDIKSFGESIYDGVKSGTDFVNISEPETFIEEINDIIDVETAYSEMEKELLKNYTTSILSMAFGALIGIPGVGLIPIVGLYTTSMLILTSTIYDQAILNSLAYTRNTRLSFRYLNSIGMY